MNLDRLNQWAMIAANVSVLGGIIFLGVELQQNTKMTQAQTRDAMTDKQMSYYELALNNIDAESQYRENQDTLQRKFMFIKLTQLRMWENELYQYKQGLFEAIEFESRLNLWEGLIARDSQDSEAMRQVWNGQRDNFSPEFVEIIDGMIDRQ